jgi:hypothetical protein
MATTVATRSATSSERAEARHVPLALVAFVLGIAAVTLAVTVIWYFAAIPIGAAAVVTGIVALRRGDDDAADTRARGRATTGAVLGLVAMVLGVSAAYFLPRVMDRVDTFFNGLQRDVNQNVIEVNRGLRGDVDRIDRTVTRDLKRLEDSNRADLADLERRNAEALSQLESRLNAAVDKATSSEKQDLATLEASLRADIRSIEASLHSTETSFSAQASAFEARIARIEKLLGIT